MVRGMATVDVALRHAELFAYADDVACDVGTPRITH